jgi:hypothetical protein
VMEQDYEVCSIIKLEDAFRESVLT